MTAQSAGPGLLFRWFLAERGVLRVPALVLRDRRGGALSGYHNIGTDAVAWMYGGILAIPTLVWLTSSRRQASRFDWVVYSLAVVGGGLAIGSAGLPANSPARAEEWLLGGAAAMLICPAVTAKRWGLGGTRAFLGWRP